MARGLAEGECILVRRIVGHKCGVCRREAKWHDILVACAFLVSWAQALRALQFGYDPWLQCEVVTPWVVHHFKRLHEVLQSDCTSGKNVANGRISDGDRFLLLYVLVNSLIHPMLQLDDHVIVYPGRAAAIYQRMEDRAFTLAHC